MTDASSPNPDARELALLLERKAAGDETILDKLLDDPDVPDEVLGFHVQQAVEKRLKAVLALNEVGSQRTHSISYLTSLLEHHRIECPEHREQLEDLTPWAIEARYSDTLGRSLDRLAVRGLVVSVREWSRGLLGGDQPPSTEQDSAERPVER